MRKQTKVMLGVIDLLGNDERCRNDDKWLIWRYLREKNGINFYIPFAQFDSMVSFETIRKVRAHIQNTKKLLLPTDEKVRKQRKISENDWEDWLRRARDGFYD